MGTLDFKVIPNFLDKEDFYKFQEEIFSTNNIPWFYKNSQTKKSINNSEDIGYFSLNFFNNFSKGFIGLDYFLDKIYTKLGCKAVIQSRANLVIKQHKNTELFFHTDYSFKCTSSIFYMNTNNGATILDENKKIKINSVENTMLIFDSQISHAALVQSDTNRRIIININYF
jgi:hypothetical protein